MSTILDTILSNLSTHKSRNAFYINKQFFTYADLSKKIAGISEALKDIPKQSTVGIVTTDSIETYASIIALWFNELIFIPISPGNSKNRNENSIQQAEVKFLLATDTVDVNIINTKDLEVIYTNNLLSDNKIENRNLDIKNILYILFTSGSTGTPKGVPISLKNLDAFIHSFINIGFNIDGQDKFLQIYDLSFDASVHCYTLPLFLGACAYTVPAKEVKFLSAYKLMKEQELTFVKMPPSTISYLKPYFPKINLQQLKYTCFGGEALPESLVTSWKKCAPNTEIHNVYGPTEATINCFSYSSVTRKSYHDVVAIGKPMKGITSLVLGDNGEFLDKNEKGELCVSGNQITPGYWKNDVKNIDAFVTVEDQIFYKTGDIVFYDNDGDYFFVDRKDNQVQIQGYRVELGEIEHHARLITNINNIVAIAQKDVKGINQISLIIESENISVQELKETLGKQLPGYMIPQQIKGIKIFPKTAGGKIDRNQLKQMI